MRFFPQGVNKRIVKIMQQLRSGMLGQALCLSESASSGMAMRFHRKNFAHL